jgi:hypothetical protein
LFAVEISSAGFQPASESPNEDSRQDAGATGTKLVEPSMLGNLTPAHAPGNLPPVCALPEATEWLNAHALTLFIEEVRAERLAEIERIGAHIELSLTELLQKADEEISKAAAGRPKGNGRRSRTRSKTRHVFPGMRSGRLPTTGLRWMC